MYVIICGGGVLGESLANSIIDKKHDVVVIEVKKDRAKYLAANLDALVLNGNAADRKILDEAGLEKAEVLVAATADDTKNLMICQHAKTAKVPKIITRVNESSNLELFLGIADTAIDITSAAISTFSKAVSLTHEHVLTPFAGGSGKLLQIPVTETSPVKGKKAKDLNFGPNANVALIDRNGQLVFDFDKIALFVGDILYIVAKAEEVQKINKMLMGD